MKRFLLIAVAAFLVAGVVTVLSLTLSGPSRPAVTSSPVVFRLQADGIRLRITGRFGTAAAPTVGEVLTTSTGGWTNNPTSFSYQWEDCNASGASCVSIQGATANSYAIVTGDIGDTIRIVVIASNAGGAGPPATSAATGVVTSGTGTITFDGDFEQGSHTQPTAIQPWGLTPQSFNWQGLNSGAHWFGDFYYDNGTSTSPTTGSLFTAASSALVPPLAGSWSGRIVLPTTPAGKSLTNVTLQGLVTPAPGDISSTNYYGLAFYIPQGEQINSSDFQGMNMWEQHFNAVWGSPVSLQLHTTGPSAVNGTGSSVVIALETGACNNAQSATPGCQYRSNAGVSPCTITSAPNIGTVTCLPGFYAIPPGAVQYGAWNELVFAVNEESTATGSIQAYYKTESSPTWLGGANITGIPTVQWDVAAGCCGFPVKEDVELYGGAESAPFSMNIDNELVGTSLAAVEALMPTVGSTPVAPVNTAVPVVSGTAQQGILLTSTTGTWTGSPSPTFGYQWQDCNSTGTGCSNINGATASGYTLVSTDVGHTVRVVVTATNTAAPNGVPANSAVTAVVTATLATGTGPSLALCSGSCTTPSSSAATTTFNVTVTGAGCASNSCQAQLWIPGNLVTNDPAHPVPLVVGYSDGSPNQDSEPDWTAISATDRFIYLGFAHNGTGGNSYGAQTVYGGTVNQGLEVAAFINALKNGQVNNPANGQPIRLDTARVFASGGSKGGSMSNETLCNTATAGLFAGVAPISEILQNNGSDATTPPSRSGSCPAIFQPGTFTLAAGRHPTMVQIVNAKNDTAYGPNNNNPPASQVPCSGGISTACIMGGTRGAGLYYFTPPEQSTVIWGAGYGCSSTPISTTTPITNVTVTTYGGCQGGVRVQDIILNSGCHSYSCSTSGPPGYDIARAAWEFWTTGDESPS